MNYKILEVRAEYEGRQLSRVTVLVDINEDLSDVRAICAIHPKQRPSNGYTDIETGEELSEKLLQRIAGYGNSQVSREEAFPLYYHPNKP